MGPLFATRAQRKEGSKNAPKRGRNLGLPGVKALSLTSAAFGNNTGEPPTGAENSSAEMADISGNSQGSRPAPEMAEG